MSDSKNWRPVLADLAIALWRMKNRLDSGNDPHELIRRQRRDIESILDRVGEKGLSIVQHTGQPYHPGSSLRVIAFEHSAEMREAEIIETVNPTVYFHSELLQMGEVVVGESNTAIPPDDN